MGLRESFSPFYKIPRNSHEKQVLKRGLTLTKGTLEKKKIGADFTEIYRKSDKLMPMKLLESMERVK